MPLTAFYNMLASRWSHRVAFRLQVWVLLAGLPSLVLGAVLVGGLYHATIVSTERSVLLAAHQAMDTLDRLMFERYGDAEVFSSLAVVRTLDRTRLQGVVNLCVTTYAPYYALAVVADRTGKVLAVSTVDASGRTIATSQLLGLSVAAEPWFQEAVANRQQVVVSNESRDLLTEALAHDQSPTIVFARAITDDSGKVVGVWSARLIVASLQHVFRQIGSRSADEFPFPMVLHTRSGETLLTIGEPGHDTPMAGVGSAGFSRWPGKRWTLEAYMPSTFRHHQWMVVGLGGAAIMLFTVAGTMGLAWIFRRQLIRPLVELEAQVRLIEAQPHRSPVELAAQRLKPIEPGAPPHEMLRHRHDELGAIARLLDVQTGEMQRHMDHLSVLNDSSRAIQEQVASLAALLERVLHTAKTLTGARYAALGVFDKTGEQLVQFLTEGVEEETTQAIGALPSGRGLLGAMIRKEGVLRLKDLTQHQESVGFPPHHPAMRSFLGMSIRAHGKLFGRIYLTDKVPSTANERQVADMSAHEVGEFTELDEQLIVALAYQAGTAIETASLIEELRATQSRDRAVLDSVGEGIYGLDRAGRCLFINRAGSRILGHAPDDLVGGDIHALIHHTREDGTPSPETECPILGAMRRQQEARLENEILWRKDGTSFPAMCAVTPLRDESGIVTGAVVSFLDLTERRALEMQVRQGQKLEALGQLAAGVAHDFNNLLTVIEGYSDLALLQADLSASTRGKIEEIIKATDRATVLTGQLLAFSRKKAIERTVVDINDAIRGVESLIRPLLGQEIAVHIDLAEGRWCAKIDRGGLEQILINLVVNARDAMPTGGRLGIRSAMLDQAATAEHLPEQKQVGSSIMITVSDTGIGMDAATQARMFEPFFTTKSLGRGTGLGLATVYRLVMENDGVIHVASEPGAGTTFTVFFPLVEPPEERSDQPVAGAPIRGKGETVLLVEDDAPVRALVKAVLENTGYHVLPANDGREGQHAAQSYEGPIHVLVCGTIMPHMSGPALARSLRVRRPDLKVLFITGGTDAELSRGGTLSTQGDVLRKPFTNDALVETVRRVLDQPIGQRCPHAPREPVRILVIDDDEQINALLQEMLTSDQYQVLAAASGEEGVGLLRNEPVDLLITDMLMPDMDGVAVIQEVRRLWPLMKILAISGGGIGMTPEFYLAMARQRGAMRTLAKPFSREQLLDVVREMID